MKKIICTILCMGLILSVFSSCGNKNPDSGTEDITEAHKLTQDATEASDITPGQNQSRFTLPYCKSDTLNPYISVSQLNLRLEALLFDGLYTLDEHLSPVEVLAESADVEKDRITVKLKKGLKFSDETVITARDAVYSFSLAKKGSYSDILNDIASAEAVDSYTVIFKLSQPDIYALSCLIFPIIPNGQGEKSAPSSSGRYYLSGEEKLKYNPARFSNGYPHIKTIYLTKSLGSDSDSDALRIGNISALFNDMRDCSVERLSSGAYKVSLNSLVFLGINQNRSLLSDKTVRKAIGTAIDREALAYNDYHDYAVAAQSPFEPSWYGLSDKVETLYSARDAAELLDRGGYKYTSDTEKFRVNKKKKALKFTLLVNKSNVFRRNTANSIKKYLSYVGIGVNVKAVSDEEYFKLIKDGSFDMYIGEVRLCPDMNLRPFLTGETSVGIDSEGSCFSSYAQLLCGGCDTEAFLHDFNESMPFVPLCYRQGVLSVSNTVSDGIKPLCTDIFYNIEQWSIKE